MITNKTRFLNIATLIMSLSFLTSCVAPHQAQNELYNNDRTSNITAEQVNILSTLGDAKLGEERNSDNGLSIKVVAHYISAMGSNCRKLNVMGSANSTKNSLVCVDAGKIYFVPPIYENINIGSAL